MIEARSHLGRAAVLAILIARLSLQALVVALAFGIGESK